MLTGAEATLRREAMLAVQTTAAGVAVAAERQHLKAERRDRPAKVAPWPAPHVLCRSMDAAEQSIREHGNLSPYVRNSARATRQLHADEFRLLGEINQRWQALILDSVPRFAGSGAWSVETVSLRLLIRSASSFQAAILLLELSLALEAEALLRTLAETAVLLAGLHAHPDSTLAHLREDSRKQEVARAALFRDQSEDDTETVSQMNARIAELEALHRGKASNLANIARDSGASVSYFMFRQLSADAAHATVNSLEVHTNRDEEGLALGYNIGPSVDGVPRALNVAIQPGIQVVGSFAKMWSVQELRETLADYQVRGLTLARKAGSARAS